MTQNSPGRAIALKVSAVFLFMVMAALIKTASDDVPPGQAVFFRSLFAIPIIALWLWGRERGRATLQIRAGAEAATFVQLVSACGVETCEPDLGQASGTDRDAEGDQAARNRPGWWAVPDAGRPSC